jgi:D-alanyl-D-alanine carboxypeptidase
VPEPQQPRGEVSEADVSEPTPDSASVRKRPAATISGELSDQAVQCDWPTEDAVGAEGSQTEESAETAPATDPEQAASEDEPARSVVASEEAADDSGSGEGGTAPDAADTPKQESHVDSSEKGEGEPEAAEPTAAQASTESAESAEEWPTDVQERVRAVGATAVAPAGVEDTQRFRKVTPEHETERLRREEEVPQGVERFSRADLSPQEPSADEPKTPPSGTRLDTDRPGVDQGPPTMRIPRVPPAPRPEEQQTQQFRRPDFSKPPPPPRSAQPNDFAGLTGSAPPRYPQGPPPQQVPPQQTPEPGTAQEPSAPQPVRSHRRRRVLITVAFLAVIGLGAWVSLSAAGVFPNLTTTPTAEPPAPVQLRPGIRPLSDAGPIPSHQGLGAALAGPVANPALGTFGGMVIDPRTGQTVWQQNAGQALTPASTGKLLAMSAAMLVLNHQERFTTKMVRGSEPGSVVLVGGGDPTLSSLPAGKESVYPGAARLDDLVAQVRAATGGQVTSIKVDTSRYAGPALAPGWDPADISGGNVAPMEPVMLDGGRADPASDVSPRSSTPALDAARELAKRLGAPNAPVAAGRAPQNAPVLGEVKSPTVQDMIETLLQHSDNMLAEAITREVAIATGNEPSFAGGVKAVREVLGRNGFPLTGTTMFEGSGLSTNDRVTPQDLGSLVAAATLPAGPDGALPPRSAQLRALLPGLPVAGGTGSLADRYQNSDARGWVRAKTGTLDGANSLAGVTVTADGRLLAFVFMSNGTGSNVARPALDTVATTLRDCGCR